jgi:hypothetical protein
VTPLVMPLVMPLVTPLRLRRLCQLAIRR